MEQALKKTGIIGEGKMGTNIFNYLFDFPCPVVWKCHPGADIDRIKKNYDKKLRRAMDSGIIDEKTTEARTTGTLITNRDEDLAGCDLLIESVNEDREIKTKLFRALDGIVNRECIFTSNSSSINPSELCPSEERREKFAGMHFFYPVSLKNIVELIIPKQASQETVRALKDFLSDVKRNHILLRESHSFILNRIYLDFQNEAYRIVHEGKVSVPEMDVIVTESFFPGGVFCFFDSVGNDVMLASVLNYTRDYPHKDYYLPLITDLQNKVENGLLGQKSGKGFFDYSQDSNIRVTVPATDPALKAEIAGRLRHAMIAAIKRIGARSGVPLDDLRTSINEYFGVDWNLFP